MANQLRQRVCVLQGRQQPDECRFVGGRCTSRSHGHISRFKALQMVADSVAVWHGNVLRMHAARHWAARPSRDARGTMMTMQLVQ